MLPRRGRGRKVGGSPDHGRLSGSGGFSGADLGAGVPPRTRSIVADGFSRSTITSCGHTCSPTFPAWSTARARTQNFHTFSSGTSHTWRPVVRVRVLSSRYFTSFHFAADLSSDHSRLTGCGI